MLSKDSSDNLIARLRAVIDTAIDGIITIDQRGNIESINSAAAGQFGYQPEEVLGQNVSKLMPEPYRSEHDGYLDRYHKDGNPRIIGIGREVTGRKKDGTLFPFRLAVSEVILHDRVIYTGIIHDLTEVKKSETGLVELTHELESRVLQRTNELEQTVNDLLRTKEELQVSLSKERELNELKSRFVSMASHEFRTPLSTILSSISLIEKYNERGEPSKQIKHVQKVKSAVGTLTGILNDFLSLSKIEEGKIEVIPTMVDLSQLMLEVTGDLESLLKGHKLSMSGIQDLKLVTDRRILKNILFNLLSNAVKYSPADSEIQCIADEQEKQIAIQIVDQGMGIPLSEQQHIFTRFFRAENAINIQGTGLGLNIVKRYISLLKGRISFTSIEGEGTTFYLELPKE